MTRDRQSAIALLVGSIAWIVTMALHPTGGSFEKIVRISSVIVGTHSLAIATIPLMLFGFLGLTARLGTDRGLPLAALVTYAFGSVAALCAAVINGLTLPAFAKQFAEADPASRDLAHMVVDYGSTMNAGFARVFGLQKTQQLIAGAVLVDDRVTDIRPVEARDEDARVLELQTRNDLAARQFVGRCGQRNARHIGKALVQS